MDYRDNKPIEPEPAAMMGPGKYFAGLFLTGTLACGYAAGFVGAAMLQREFPKHVAKSIALEATDMVPRGMNQDSAMYYPLKAGSLVMKAGAHVGFFAGDIVYELMSTK